MRLLILSLLALALDAQGHSISYRNNLLAYAPARGEFPVQGDVAQGYLSYVDNTGAERLVGFSYPEPLYGMHSSSFDNIETLRAWCEQQYNALRIELERLRAEGKQPSANILAKFEPLQQLSQSNAFEPVSGWSPAVQLARDEQLRIWKANHLQIKQSFPLATPQPVQETDEVSRAREEHLKRFNQALQAQIRTLVEAPLLKANIEPQQSVPQTPQLPQPVEETPEVKRAREEHLRQYNEELQRQSVPQPTAELKIVKSEAPLPMAIKAVEPIAPLPAVTIKSSNPVPVPIEKAQSKHDQRIQQLSQSKIQAEDKVADIEDLIRIEQMEEERERNREQQLRREEEKQAELEREREQLRLMEEKQLLEAERISLLQQEQQRIESERLLESKRLQAEQQLILSADKPTAEPSSSYKLIAPTPVKPQPQPQLISQQQQVQNGFFLRIQSGQPSSEPISEGIQSQNPFLIRYIQQPQPQAQAQVKISSSIAASSPSSSAYLSSSNSVPAGLSELEKATREHFKAHEIALEQLRLANLKNPEANPIPC
ncbi:zinc finger protein 853 [Drosophila innubila]|uniref:zinc finger protein 853 n=1 Tax=Drosophila innubila TaxID=198719 RepID=UPI00148B4D82|nr:zinc finger protein 853 [Drosophila innubila]